MQIREQGLFKGNVEMHRSGLLMQMPPGLVSQGLQLLLHPCVEAIRGTCSAPAAHRGEEGFLIRGLIGPFIFET